MQSFAQFMTGETVTSGLDMQPDKGQTWQFADGRQGVIASVDVTSAMVYVGPEPFRVPRGDWPIVFGAASLVQPPAAAPAPAPAPGTWQSVTLNIDTPVDSPTFPPGFGERFPPGGPPGGPPVVEPAPVEPAAASVGRSRRDRKR